MKFFFPTKFIFESLTHINFYLFLSLLFFFLLTNVTHYSRDNFSQNIRVSRTEGGTSGVEGQKIFPTQPSLGSVTVKLLTNCQHFVNRISNKSELNKNSALVFGVFLFTLTESLLFHFLMYPAKQAGNRKKKIGEKK